MVRIILAVKDDLALAIKTLDSSSTDIWIELGSYVVIGGVYRQWRTINGEEADLAALHERARDVAARYKNVLVAGDFNLDVNRINDALYCRRSLLSAHLVEMEAAGFSFAGPFTDTYTSHGKYGAKKVSRTSRLDHVYLAGIISREAEVVALPNAATDHRPVLASVLVPCARAASTTVTFPSRPWKRITENALLNAINPSALSRVFLTEDVDLIHAIIIGEVSRAVDVIAPSRTTIIKDRNFPLSLAPDTRRAMVTRDRAAAAGCPSYRRRRNEAARLVRRDKLISALEAVNSCKGSATRMWKMANGLMGRTKGADLPATLINGDGKSVQGGNIPNEMNAFYLAKIEKIRNAIQAGSSGGMCNENEEKSSGVLSFNQVSPSEVVRLFRGLNNTRAAGKDGLPVAVWKAAARIVAEPVARLINCSFDAGKVPLAFKEAFVTPVFKGKGKAKDEMGSYRPVAVLPALSKVMEAAALARLSPFLRSRLPGEQFGFRTGRNAAQAVALAHGTWTKAAMSGKKVVISAFDYTAAFDTLDPLVLVNKLETLGISGKPSKWLKDYLTGRQQRVKYGRTLSNSLPVTHGVPQGSLLGPVLFTCLVAGLPAALSAVDGGDDDQFGGSVAYADDVVAWSSGRTVAIAKKRMENKARAMCAYSASHLLSINPSKTQILWVGASRDEELNVEVGCTIIKPAKEMEMLGMKIDSKLRFTPYVEAQVDAAKAIRGTIRRLSLHLPHTELLGTVARSLIMGKVGYGAAATYTLRFEDDEPADVASKALQVVLNDVARSILGERRSSRIRIEELLGRAGMSSVNRLTARAIAMEAWKACRGINTPEDLLRNLLGEPGRMSRDTRAAAQDNLPPPLPRPAKTFVWAAYKIWNSSKKLREAKTLNVAKKVALEISKSFPL